MTPGSGSGRPLRVAMIGAKGVPARVGGVERVVEELGARLAERGHEITVYCRKRYSDPAVGNRYRGMTLRWTPAWPGKYTDSISHAFTAFGDALRRDFDILHFHGLGVGPVIASAWLAGSRVLTQIHGQEWKGGKWGRMARTYFKACEPVVLDFSHEVVVISRASQEYYRAAYGCETTYIPNAIDVPEPKDTGVLNTLGVEPRKYLLFVGRLVPEKGCHYLVQAHRSLKLEIPVVVVGEASHSTGYAEELKRTAGPHFRFAGTRVGDELTDLYARSLLVVSPTEREGMSMVLLEAMGQGACVVASDIPEMVEGMNGSGYHFRQRDAVDLGRVLKRLLADPGAVESVRERARAQVRSVHCWEPVTERFEALYRRML